MSQCSRHAILDVLQSHTRLLAELLPERIQEFEGSVDALKFLREFVGPAKPLVIRQDEDVASWPARTLWQDQEYLNRVLRDQRVTVALTPDGLADAVVDGQFTLPAYDQMPYQRFIEMLKKQDPVVYLQKQNDSFNTEFRRLGNDVGCISWMNEAFGEDAGLDAINFWQGAAPTKTSWHRDPYENVYVVLRGTKRVRLLPSTDGYRMKMREFPQSEWRYENGKFGKHQLDADPVPWSSLAPCSCSEFTDGRSCWSCAHLADHPPKDILLNAGDVLYIPAFTYHELSHDPLQHDSTIAINFWFDTQYGNHGFATMETFDRLARLSL